MEFVPLPATDAMAQISKIHRLEQCMYWPYASIKKRHPTDKLILSASVSTILLSSPNDHIAMLVLCLCGGVHTHHPKDGECLKLHVNEPLPKQL